MNHTIRNIAVFASGNGSNFEAIVRACKENKIDRIVACLRPTRRLCFGKSQKAGYKAIRFRPQIV